MGRTSRSQRVGHRGRQWVGCRSQHCGSGSPTIVEVRVKGVGFKPDDAVDDGQGWM